MKLDEETVKAIAILNCCSNETGDAEGNAIPHRAIRYLVMQNEIQPSCQMQFSLLLARVA